VLSYRIQHSQELPCAASAVTETTKGLGELLYKVSSKKKVRLCVATGKAPKRSAGTYVSEAGKVFLQEEAGHRTRKPPETTCSTYLESIAVR